MPVVASNALSSNPKRFNALSFLQHIYPAPSTTNLVNPARRATPCPLPVAYAAVITGAKGQSLLRYIKTSYKCDKIWRKCLYKE
jgi:hypothetical protein